MAPLKTVAPGGLHPSPRNEAFSLGTSASESAADGQSGCGAFFEMIEPHGGVLASCTRLALVCEIGMTETCILTPALTLRPCFLARRRSGGC
jgi:hypothetical protein